VAEEEHNAEDDDQTKLTTQRGPACEHRTLSMQSTGGSACRADRGEFAPIVDRAKCEGKAECVDVCPCNVFEVRRMDDADFAALGILARIKSIAHGRKTAYTPHAAACEACGKCVEACPEKAIKLARSRSASF
jgi:NAD-dependent dihydropyrimidine dehydrogenase PreA subunit